MEYAIVNQNSVKNSHIKYITKKIMLIIGIFKYLLYNININIFPIQ